MLILPGCTRESGLAAWCDRRCHVNPAAAAPATFGVTVPAHEAASIVPAAMKQANDAAQREANTPTTGSGGGAATETLDRKMLESAFSLAHDLANTPHGASHPQQTGMMLADSMSYHHTQPLGMSSPVRAYDAPVMSSQPR